MHELIALEPNTVAYCIHAMRIGESVDDIVDMSMIPNGVNVEDIFPDKVTCNFK